MNFTTNYYMYQNNKKLVQKKLHGFSQKKSLSPLVKMNIGTIQ